MPEIANCPLCGNALRMDQWRWPECTACPFRCALSDLPRVSAAMELVEAAVEYENSNSLTVVKNGQNLTVAHNKAMEVFK